MRSKKISLEKCLIIALILINAVSIFGFSTFGLHPQLLSRWPWSVSIFAVSYPLFARLQIVAAFLALATMLTRVTRWEWLPSFLLLFFLSCGSELLGTTYGFPFGKYEYTGFLGPKIFDRVPWLIPLSWFFMAFYRIVLASLLLLAWDITLDPAMSHLAPFWLWNNPGDYYGMPASNLLGWFFTGLLLMVVLEWTAVRTWMSKVSSRYLALLYVVNLALPFGMCIAASLWIPVAVTCVIAAILFWVVPAGALSPAIPAANL
jgi:putative membrane protein